MVVFVQQAGSIASKGIVGHIKLLDGAVDQSNSKHMHI